MDLVHPPDHRHSELNPFVSEWIGWWHSVRIRNIGLVGGHWIDWRWSVLSNLLESHWTLTMTLSRQKYGQRGESGESEIERGVPHRYRLDIVSADIRDHLQSVSRRRPSHRSSLTTKRKGGGMDSFVLCPHSYTSTKCKNILIGCKRESEIRRARKQDITTKLFCREWKQ